MTPGTHHFSMKRRIALATLIALAVTFIPRVAHAASSLYPGDTYFQNYISNTSSFNPPDGLTWAPGGDSTGVVTGNSYPGNFNPSLGTCYSASSGAGFNASSHTWATTGSGGNYLDACSASSQWPSGERGLPKSFQPGPFSVAGVSDSYDAMNLGGGVLANFAAPYSATAWSICMWFAPQDSQGSIVFATGIQASGLPTNNALVLATGTVNNLVLYQYGQARPSISEDLHTNGSWVWACIEYNSANNQASLVGFNSTTVHTMTLAASLSTSNGVTGNSNYIWSAGDLWTYGFSVARCISCLEYEWQVPTSPAAGGGGSIGNLNGGGGTSGCTQVGMISGEAKVQWCAPNLQCSNIDLSWLNIGQDFQWLGCIVSQALLNLASLLVNALIDLLIPSTTALTNDWNGFVSEVQSHVPTNYIYGALTFVPTAFNGAHTNPSLDLALPPPWSTTIHITWANMLGPFSGYRPLFAALVYLLFAITLTVEARRAFEN